MNAPETDDLLITNQFFVHNLDQSTECDREYPTSALGEWHVTSMPRFDVTTAI